MQRGIRRRTLIAGGLAAAGAAALGEFWWSRRGDPTVPAPLLTSYADLMGCIYTADADAPLAAVRLRRIRVPEVPGGAAIWGATGRDHRGHIWFGVSTGDVPPASAHLFEYDPATDVVHNRGDVVAELRRAGVLRRGEQQMKIHSRIVQAEDGSLYFASMDEHGEATNGSRLPTWGSHLWRLHLTDYRWEHLLTVPEGLIAVATSGPRIVALGYFDHTLYQYDCRTGGTTSVHVGAAGGHISRNCFCDIHGHTYIPRLEGGPNQRTMRTSLVELDTDLQMVAQTPIAFYTQTRDDDSHGIVAFQPLADRSIVFATDQGCLYQVIPHEDAPADVSMLGMMHPRGRSYTAALFTSDGVHHLMGLTRDESRGARALTWLVYDLARRSAVMAPLEVPEADGQRLSALSVYGSITRDNEGRCYVGGTVEHNGQPRPVFLQIGTSV